MAKKGCLAVLAALAISGAANAQVIVSGGFTVPFVSVTEKRTNYRGNFSDLESGIGGNLSFDFLLPVNIPLSLGFEVGIDRFSYVNEEFGSILAIPILFRGAYHFDVMPKFDLYLVGKFGYALSTWIGNEDWLKGSGNPHGFAFGFDLGFAYYFTSVLGVFGEAGYDHYMLSIEGRNDGNDRWSWFKIATYFYRFFTFGLCLKL
jgi:opacity protein-like surface antigen